MNTCTECVTSLKNSEYVICDVQRNICKEEDIIFIDASGKEVNVASETEISLIINDTNINHQETPTSIGNTINPLVTTSDVNNPLVDTSDVNNPLVDTSDVNNPLVDTSDVNNPLVSYQGR